MDDQAKPEAASPIRPTNGNDSSPLLPFVFAFSSDSESTHQITPAAGRLAAAPPSGSVRPPLDRGITNAWRGWVRRTRVSGSAPPLPLRRRTGCYAARLRVPHLVGAPPRRLRGSRNCLGCAKPTPIIAVDEPSKGLRIQGRSIKQRSLSEDFWSSSPPCMENSTMQSQRSMSSISTAAQSSDQHGAGSNTNPNEFVNQGLLLWNQTRLQWVGNRKHNPQCQQPREPKISWNATYESLLGSTKPFAQQIPLGEMIDFLVDGWEQEGLYD